MRGAAAPAPRPPVPPGSLALNCAPSQVKRTTPCRDEPGSVERVFLLLSCGLHSGRAARLQVLKKRGGSRGSREAQGDTGV